MVPGDGAAVFELQDVRRRFGTTEALAGVDLVVRAGERVALAGPSGAGKTTLIGLLNGTLLPTGGSLRVFGHDTRELSGRKLQRLRQRIGTVYQNFYLVDELRVVHNVNAGRLGRWSLARAALSLVWPREVAQARTVLERVGLADKLYERTGDLSGGEQQRVALSRVLAQDPEVILADEPIASLDRENSREVMDLLRDLATERGRTAVISLHDMRFALSHCERVVGLRAGKVLFDAPAAAVTPDMTDELYRLET